MRNNQNKTYFHPSIPEGQLARLAYDDERIKAEKRQLRKTGLFIGAAILGYIIIQTLISQIAFYGKAGLKDLYDSSPVFNSGFNMLVVHFCSVLIPFGLMALILRKQFVTPVIPSKKVEKSILFSWIGLGMMLCVSANFIVSIVITICESLGYKLTQGETPEPDSLLACFICFVATAIVPAVFEEFAMRCCTLGVLRKYGTGFAVLTVSVVFGLLHGNVIQFIFAFLIGLVLAYVTVRTESVLPAILIHFCNNGISATNDIVNYFVDKDVSNYVVSGLYIMWLVFGAIGFICLLRKKELLPPKKKNTEKDSSGLTFGTKCLCLLPGFSVPFLMLIVITVMTIKKI